MDSHSFLKCIHRSVLGFSEFPYLGSFVIKSVDDYKIEISVILLKFYLIWFLSCKLNEDLPRLSQNNLQEGD